MSAHLTPEQFQDWCLGMGTAAATAHLMECERCRGEAAGVREALGAFRAAAVEWSETAGASLAGSRASRARRSPWARRAWVLAAAVVFLGLGVPLAHRRGESREAAVGARQAQQAQIARDNQLLARIEADAAETTPAPLERLQVNAKEN